MLSGMLSHGYAGDCDSAEEAVPVQIPLYQLGQVGRCGACPNPLSAVVPNKIALSTVMGQLGDLDGARFLPSLFPLWHCLNPISPRVLFLYYHAPFSPVILYFPASFAHCAQ